MFVGMIEGEEKRPKKLQAYLKYDHGVNGHDAFHPMRCLGANTGFKAKLCKIGKTSSQQEQQQQQQLTPQLDTACGW